VTSDEPPYEDDEQAEAELLARTLAAGRQAPSRVDDALDAAEVVRMLRAPVLNEERLNAVLADGERRVAQARRRSRIRIAALGSATGALALAAAVLLMVRTTQHEPSAVVAVAPAQSPVPEAPSAPSAEAAKTPGAVPAGGAGSAEQALRQAQIAWLEMATGETREQLERALVAYRGEQLAQLQQRYTR
jgi:hypothetical protein